jgi:DNA-binding response OmpR family regulator
MRLLIVEDDEPLSAALGKGLKEAGFEVARVGSVAAARRALAAGRPDLVVLDLGLPDESGIGLLRELAAAKPPLPVIVSTARGEVADRVEGLEGGADDYLVKPYAFAELLARIRVQLRHAARPTGTARRMADLELDLRGRTVTRGGRRLDLTPREFDLLAYLVEAEGKVVTRDMLARDVWHVRSRMTSMDNVIDVHISRLREQLDKGAPTRLLHTIRGAGFRLGETP